MNFSLFLFEISLKYALKDLINAKLKLLLEGQSHNLNNIDEAPCHYTTRGRFNIKMSSYQYRDPHVKDKMVSQSSYL